MGCTPSKTKEKRAPPVEHIPDCTELTEKFVPLDREPVLVSEENNLSSEEQIRLMIKKYNKNNKGDSFGVKNFEAKSGDWLGEQGVFVEPIHKFGFVGRSLESFTGVFRGKEGLPLAYWVIDVSHGVNKYKILKNEPAYKGQEALNFKGRDVKNAVLNQASPFKGRTEIDLYSYAYVTFDLDTTVVSVKVYGAPTIKDHQPLYQMRQANKTTWIIYRYSFGDDKYNECAMLVQGRGTMRFPTYETTICPGVDPILTICLVTIIDSFWEYRLRKARVQFY
jgi:hypothetical protein